MNELIEWMRETGHTNSSLARKMNFSYEYIHKITSGDRPITEAFKWRFAEKLGWHEAERVFGIAAEPVTHEPA